MNKKVSLVLVAVGLLLLSAGCSGATSNNSGGATNTPSNSQSANTGTQAGGGSESQGQVKTFTVNAGNFKFDINEIKVKKGDTVKIVFNNNQGFHDWVIDEFNARTPQIGAGKTETIQFIADKTGTFEYYCSVGSHRQMGMKGNLIVE